MRPALWMAAALSAGILAADWLRPHPVLAMTILIIVTALTAMRRDRRGANLLLLLTIFFLGALLYAYHQTAGRGDLAAWQNQRVALTATVISEPELWRTSEVSYIIDVEQVEGHVASGKVYISQRGGKVPGFGERIKLTAYLKAPIGAKQPGAFDQAAYLARQGVYLESTSGPAYCTGEPGRLNPLRRAAVAVRIRLEEVLTATLPHTEAALMAGLLFGSRSDLPQEVKEAFKNSGVLHLLAVSGGNIAMIIIPVIGLLRRCGVSARMASALAIPLVIFFLFLTGAGPSVLRAGLMAVLVLLGDLLRRERNALNTLGAAAFFLLLWEPTLLFDLGFQFSVAATLGILLFARPIEHWLALRCRRFCGERCGQWLAAGLSVTLAAQMLVEPISMYSFGAFSAIAPIANLLILAFLEPVVRLGTVSALIGLIWIGAAWLLNWPVRLGLWLLLFLVRFTAAVPGAYLTIGALPLCWVILWYLTIVLFATSTLRGALLMYTTRLLEWWREKPLRRTAATVAYGLLILLIGMASRIVLADPPDLLTVTFLDVGQGDAIVLQAPSGATMLIDAGGYIPPDPKMGRRGYDAGRDVILPYLDRQGIGRLDYLVLTHADQDHAGGGATILEEVAVGALLTADVEAGEGRYRTALDIAVHKKIPIQRPTQGARIKLSDDVLLDVLNPYPHALVGTRSDTNSNCVAFRLHYRQIAMLFTCDIEAATEERLLAQKISLHADLLKVAHHGSGYSSTAPFLQAVRPHWAVISVGNGNAYKHPHPATLERLKRVGAEVYRTDLQGSIMARTDGRILSVAGTRRVMAQAPIRPLGILGRRWLFAW